MQVQTQVELISFNHEAQEGKIQAEPMKNRIVMQRLLRAHARFCFTFFTLSQIERFTTSVYYTVSQKTFQVFLLCICQI